METNKLDTKKKFKTALHAAVAYLIGMGIIENEGDVANELQVEKGNFSSFKNGKKPISGNFVVKFENRYDLKLKDFDPTTYEPTFGIKQKSGTTQAPDQNLLTQIEDYANNILISLKALKKAPDHVFQRETNGNLGPSQNMNISGKTKTEKKQEDI